MHTIGHSEKVGNFKTCVYQHGKLIKQVTEIIPNKRLAFRVVEQDQIENDGAMLLDGSFDLDPVDDGKQTRVRLTTRYIPLLNPRFAYQWAESLAIHTLHGHVLAGMVSFCVIGPPGAIENAVCNLGAPGGFLGGCGG